ncbi:N-acetylglucosamine kinase [Nonomuraea endophytica]|uniref:N-acetylglucosamine kinase-like BadF-type ATPase n=1 Tax=Nonomuraea endophytica TaxID=714136 RepID=A0A7W7ZYN0_9ACTN|nr:BadF/BadG/BcrA/BcrD ATPase family protein [Nonomuraea endophytica]MBB5075710.1 N-acetylglucosamine kinase-like BadF-type ATPase [Nonomuraea endophytica]
MDLAIDGGQTGLRVALSFRGQVREVRELAGLSYAEGSPADAVLARLSPLELPKGVDTVCLGLTTLLDDPERLARLLLEHTRRVVITTDVVTSHAGAFPSGNGVVLAAGTGAIALGIAAAESPPVQVDGWGFLFGDAGSGFWIGRRGLDVAYRGFDGRGPEGSLTARAREVFGDLATLPHRLYLAQDAVARIARFAPHVFELAATDAAAGEIVDAAATELAGTVAAAARHFTGEVPVAWTGRLLRDERLRAGFESALKSRLPQARICPAAGDSLTGAARLAAAPDLGLYAPLATVTHREAAQ